ncbi:hypothetical protein ABD440_16560 [Chromobacterium piscinae]
MSALASMTCCCSGASKLADVGAGVDDLLLQRGQQAGQALRRQRLTLGTIQQFDQPLQAVAGAHQARHASADGVFNAQAQIGQLAQRLA